MSDGFKDFLVIVSICVVGWLIILGFAFGMASIFGTLECKNRWEGSEYDYKYSIISGCLIKHGNIGWVPDKNVIAID